METPSDLMQSEELISKSDPLGDCHKFSVAYVSFLGLSDRALQA
jgi:hypothetical protein